MYALVRRRRTHSAATALLKRMHAAPSGDERNVGVFRGMSASLRRRACWASPHPSTMNHILSGRQQKQQQAQPTINLHNRKEQRRETPTPFGEKKRDFHRYQRRAKTTSAMDHPPGGRAGELSPSPCRETAGGKPRRHPPPSSPG